MKLLLTIIVTSILFVSCAHKNESHVSDKNSKMYQCTSPNYKGDMYNKSCALAVSKGKLHVTGSDKYKVERNGKVYYFKSKKSKKEFLKNADRIIKRANKLWVMRRTGR